MGERKETERQEREKGKGEKEKREKKEKGDKKRRKDVINKKGHEPKGVRSPEEGKASAVLSFGKGMESVKEGKWEWRRRREGGKKDIKGKERKEPKKGIEGVIKEGKEQERKRKKRKGYHR